MLILLLPAHLDLWITPAKEIRQLYTLDPIQDTTVAPPPLDTAPAVTVPQLTAPNAPVPRVLSAPTPDSTGPIRVARKSRMKTRPLPTRTNKRAPASTTTPTNTGAPQSQVESPDVDVSQDIARMHQVDPPQVHTLPSDIPQANATHVEPNVPVVATIPSDITPVPADVPDDGMSDSLSYTSTLPEIFDTGTDDSAPPATGPWMIIDHFTGEITVDDDQSPPVPDAPTIPNTHSDPSPAVVKVAIAARSGVPYLVETPPTLLDEDKDVRPQWLMTAIGTFFPFVPYVGGLGKVVDLYLAQEARLGYPQLVCAHSSYFIIYILTISVHSSPTSIRKPAHRDCRIYEMGQKVRSGQQH